MGDRQGTSRTSSVRHAEFRRGAKLADRGYLDLMRHVEGMVSTESPVKKSEFVV